MQEIYIEEVGKVLQNKKKLEDELNVKITNRGKNVFVDGGTEDEFTAMQVMEAINTGFSIDKTLELKEEEIILQRVNIKNITKRQDLERVRGRIIGTEGKTLKTLNNLTGCEFAIKDNVIGIIGNTEDMEDAIQAIKSIIHGSKQSNVYARAERLKKKRRLEPVDLDNELR